MTRNTPSRQKSEDRPLYYGQVVMISPRGYGFLYCEHLDSQVYFRFDRCAELYFRARDEVIRFTGGQGLPLEQPAMNDLIVFRAYYDPQRDNYHATSWVFANEFVRLQNLLEKLTEFRVVDIKRVTDDPSQNREKIIWQGRTLEGFRWRFPVRDGKDRFIPLRTFQDGDVRFEMRLESLHKEQWVTHIHSVPEDLLPSFVPFSHYDLQRRAAE